MAGSNSPGAAATRSGASPSPGRGSVFRLHRSTGERANGANPALPPAGCGWLATDAASVGSTSWTGISRTGGVRVGAAAFAAASAVVQRMPETWITKSPSTTNCR